jgi:arsenate reductase
MNVSELARLAGTTPYALRWYESIGVLPAPARSANGYRAYNESDLARIRLVVTLRRLGLPPIEAGRVALLCLEGGQVDKRLEEMLADQRVAISRQRADLDRLEGQLLDLELTLAASRAHALQRAGGYTSAPTRVLFVSPHCSARAPIAEGLLWRYGGGAFAVASAGIDPRSVSPLTVRVLAELGINWANAQSRSIEEFVGDSFDYVITLSDRAHNISPVLRGSSVQLHWRLSDPDEAIGAEADRLEEFRRIRNDLSVRLGPFIEVVRGSRAMAGS